MLRFRFVATLLAACCALAARAQEDKPPELPALPATPPPQLPDQPPPELSQPDLPDLSQLLEAPSIKPTRAGGKKLVGVAIDYRSVEGLDELKNLLNDLVGQKADIVQLDSALIPCSPNDANCIADLGKGKDVDVILFGQVSKVENGFSASVRAVDPEAPKGKKMISRVDQNLDSKEPSHVRAWAEAIACRLKLQTACTAEFRVSADLPQFRLLLDNKELGSPYSVGGTPKTYSAAVGVHKARVMLGQNTSLEQRLPIATKFAEPQLLYARRLDKGGLVLQPESAFPTDVDGKVRIAPSVAPGPESSTKRIVSYALFGAGAIAAGFGAYEGLHGKSLQSSANDAYNSRGAYTQADVGNLNSGASALKTANVLFVVGAVLVAAGGVLTFAF